MSKKKDTEGKHYCRECVHARDFHEKNWKGEWFLCKCDFQHRSMFLNLESCTKFKKRRNDEK